MNHKQLFAGLACVFFATAMPVARAIDLDAGDYDTAPAGTTAALLYLQDGEKDGLYSGSTKEPGDNKLDADIGIARFVHYTTWLDHLVQPQVLVPFGHLAGKDDASGLGSASGLGDIIFAMPMWFVNDTTAHEYLGVTPYLYVPTGSYDASKALNLGENRWKGNLQSAYSRRLAPHVAWDVSADVTVYGDNTNAAGGGSLSQDPGYEVQTNMRYFLSDTSDVRAGISYTDAGKTTQNGISSNAFTESKFWVGTAFFFLPKTQAILTWGSDIAVSNGFKDISQINLRLLQVF